MTAAVVAGLLAGWAVALPLGAVAAHLVALSASAPWRAGVAAALGVAVADGAYALVAVLGGAAAASVLSAVAGPLRWLSAAVLLGVAVRTTVVALRPAGTAVAPTAQRAFVRLLAMTLVNPLTVVAFTAVVVGSRTVAATSPAERLAFALAAFVASATWQLLLVGCGAALGRALTGRRGRLATALVSGAVMSALALDGLLG